MTLTGQQRSAIERKQRLDDDLGSKTILLYQKADKIFKTKHIATKGQVQCGIYSNT